ncbi:MAG: polysaccharide biosynthesis tyrosine autokinase [Oscillospiraceae bacterium]|nr:polysaccharide biosynthesis tyrosine autokinase [Oscillospiraceae bacterium]
MQDKADKKEILFFFRKAAKWVVGSALLGFIIAFVISSYVLPKKYTAHIDMYVNNKLENADTVDISEINAAQRLVNNYIVILENDDILEKVRRRMFNRISIRELKSSLLMRTVQNATEVLRISVETGDPDLSTEICGVWADVAPVELERIVQTGSVVVIGRPRTPTEPSFPNVRNSSIMGFLAGAMFAVGIGFLVFFADNSVKSGGDLKLRIGAPVLGEIPSFDAIPGQKQKKRTGNVRQGSALLEKNAPFHIVEAYKSLRANLLFTLTDPSQKAVVVSSSELAAGKSNTTANLAIAMAQTGLKTVILDADMRKPIQHKLFGLNNKIGLSQLLCHIVKLNEAVNRDVVPDLDVITCGAIPPNPSELLGSQSMIGLLECLSEYYDYIFIDTPPIGVVSDALMAANKTAGILLVARQKQSLYRELQKTIETLNNLNIANLGIVVNDTHEEYKMYKYTGYKGYKKNEEYC